MRSEEPKVSALDEPLLIIFFLSNHNGKWCEWLMNQSGNSVIIICADAFSVKMGTHQNR